MKTWLFLFAIDLLIYYLVSLKLGAVMFVLIFVKILWDVGLFTSIKFSTGQIKRSEVFYVNYTGEYHKVGKEFGKFSTIMNKFKLDRSVYNTFGIYYDDPKLMVDKTKCRAVIGIVKEYDQFSRDKPEVNVELEEYLRNNNFKQAELPETNALRVIFPFLNVMSLIIGINKFYKSLNENLKNEKFKKSFKVDSMKISCIMEVYNENDINFYVPLQNNERFNLHYKIE